MKTIFILPALLAAASLPACTAERAYGSAQMWQQVPTLSLNR